MKWKIWFNFFLVCYPICTLNGKLLLYCVYILLFGRLRGENITKRKIRRTFDGIFLFLLFFRFSLFLWFLSSKRFLNCVIKNRHTLSIPLFWFFNFHSSHRFGSLWMVAWAFRWHRKKLCILDNVRKSIFKCPFYRYFRKFLFFV